MKITNSTRRALRTVVQDIYAAAVAAPFIVAEVEHTNHDPRVAVIAGTYLAAAAAVVKTVNVLEDNHLMPSWLIPTRDGGTSAPAPVDDSAVAPPAHVGMDEPPAPAAGTS